jgi:hypothetical protein
MLRILFNSNVSILMSATPIQFPHRHNSDGTYDSICPKCYRTVDTQRLEGSLAAEEKAHVCHQDDLLPRDVFDTQNRDPA